MASQPATGPGATDATARGERASFFRQSVWMMIATIGGGVMMAGIHFLSRAIGQEQYKILGALLSVSMCVPAIPLQMVFAQQTAAALARERRGELTGMIRSAGLGIFALWLIASAITLMFQNQIVRGWGLSNPAGLWVTLLVVLFSLWGPMFSGVMQGQQNFLWLGWSTILGAAGRLGAAVFIVLALAGRATGIMTGVLIGLVVTCGVGLWQTGPLWRGRSETFLWGEVLKQVIPLLIGFAAFQFLFTGDTMFVAHYFDAEKAAPYVAAGTMSRALLWLVLPLATVMFPKIVHSMARAEKNTLLAMVLAATAALAGAGVAALWMFGSLAVKIVFGSAYVAETMSVLFWYTGAMIPLVLSNVLVNDLLARSRFGVVPVLVAVAAGYGLALSRFHATLIMVLQVMGGFNLLALAVCALFTWGIKSAGTPAAARQP